MPDLLVKGAAILVFCSLVAGVVLVRMARMRDTMVSRASM